MLQVGLQTHSINSTCHKVKLETIVTHSLENRKCFSVFVHTFYWTSFNLFNTFLSLHYEWCKILKMCMYLVLLPYFLGLFFLPTAVCGEGNNDRSRDCGGGGTVCGLLSVWNLVMLLLSRLR